MKTKKLVKKALKHPDLYTWGDLEYFRKWLEQRKLKKKQKKQRKLLE